MRVSGPREQASIPGLIRRFHDAKIEGKSSVEIWGSGSPLREFLYVDDLADACLFLMEKYDGVRVYWDGKQLYRSSSKTVIDVPSRYSLPSIPFEGELW